MPWCNTRGHAATKCLCGLYAAELVLIEGSIYLKLQPHFSACIYDLYTSIE
jgi:hypothetical protein